MTIHGAKKGSSKQRQPIIAPDSAQSKTYIKILYGLGEGEIAGLACGYKSVYLDDTPLQNDNGEFNFTGVKVDFRTGTNDQTYIDGFPDVASETAVGVELKHGTPYIKAFNNLDLDALRVRLKWGTLRQQNRENGDVGGVKIDYAIDVKTDNGGWVEALNTSINAKTSNAYERSHRIDLPKAGAGWQLRIRRITPNSTSDFVSDKMYISAISEVIDLKLRYPNTALLGLRYGAEQFSNVAKMSARCRGLIIKVPTNYDPVARTYTGMWDGQFKMAYSNNPAWVYYDLCTATRYGLGGRLTEYMIDKWSLYRLAQYCDEMVDDGMGGTEPRFTVNVYIQSADGAFELLSRLAGVFRAISYWDGTSIVLDADIPQDSIYSFSRANVIDGVFEYTGTRSRDRHTVAKVAWDNPANHFKTEYEYVRDEAAIAKFGVRVADIQAWGCTSRGQAQRAGLWALKSEQLETRMVTFKVGLDGHIPAPAKVIEISDELFAGRATGGRVLAINKAKTVITLDRAITAKTGDTLVINGDDGTSQRRQIRSVSGDKITVTKAFTNISVENVWVLDSQDLATMKFRVLSVTADENHQFTITAVQYNPVKYDAIDHGAYTHERPISVINPTVQAPTKSVNLSSYHTVNQGVSITTLVIGWEQVAGAVKYQVEWRADNGNWQTLPPTGTNSIEIAGVYAGAYEARVTAISAFGQASLATHSNLTQIQGKQGKPPRPINLTIQGLLFAMNVGWNFDRGSDDTSYTQIQVSPDGRSNITTLGTFAYPTNKHEITGLQGNLTQFYRARIVDKLGNTSDWTDWAHGTTSADAGKVLDMLSGQISQSHLDQSLRTPIGKIGTLEGAVNSVNGNLSTLNHKLATAQNELATAKSTLQTAVGNITTERNRITAAIRDITTLQADKNTKTAELANLTQTVGSHTSSIRKLGVTTGDLSQKYSQLKTQADNANSEIGTIKQTQSGQASSIEKLSARFDNGNLFKASTATNRHFLDENNGGQLTAWASHRASDFISVKTNTVYEIRSFEGNFSNLRVMWYDDGKNFVKGQIILARGDYATFNSENARYVRISSGWTRKDDNIWQMQVAGLASDAMANLDELRQTTANADRALAERITGVDTAYKQADTATNAKLATAEKAISDTNQALSQRINTLDAQYKKADTDLTARLAREETARATGDNANSQAIGTLESTVQGVSGRVGTSESKIATLERTTSDTNQALATAQSQLSARFEHANLFKASTATLGHYYAEREGGALKPWGSHRASDDIAVSQNTLYEIKAYNGNFSNLRVIWLDESKEFIKGQIIAKGGDYATFNSENARYVRISSGWMRQDDNVWVMQKIGAVGDVMVNLDEFKQAVATKDTALTQKLSKLQSDIGTKANTAALNSLTTKVNQADGKITAQAQRLNTVQSSVSGNTSSINTLSQSLTTKERALSEQISTVQTTLSGQTASIEQHAQSLNGLSAQWTLKVQSGGVVSGIGLASNNGISDFSIRADKFYITSPTGGNKSPMFTVTTRPTTINGTTVPAGVYLSDAYIQNASITMAKIADSIQSDNYVAGRQGWRLFKDGRFELNNTFGDGSSLELNSKGLTVWYDKAQGKKAVELGILT